MRTLSLLLTLLLASPAVSAWDVVVNGGQPVRLVAGQTGAFEIAVTRTPDDPGSFYGSAIFDGRAQPAGAIPFWLLHSDTARCALGEYGFLPPPGLVALFQVTPLAMGETVRCRIAIEVAPDASPGAYPLTLLGGASFTILIGIAPPAQVPATALPALLLLALGLMLVARRRG